MPSRPIYRAFFVCGLVCRGEADRVLVWLCWNVTWCRARVSGCWLVLPRVSGGEAKSVLVNVWPRVCRGYVRVGSTVGAC